MGRPGADHPARGPGQNRYNPVSEKKAEDSARITSSVRGTPSRKPWGRRRALPGAWGSAHQDPRRREETAVTATLRSQLHWGTEKAWTCTLWSPASGCPRGGGSSFSRRRHDLTRARRVELGPASGGRRRLPCAQQRFTPGPGRLLHHTFNQFSLPAPLEARRTLWCSPSP